MNEMQTVGGLTVEMSDNEKRAIRHTKTRNLNVYLTRHGIDVKVDKDAVRDAEKIVEKNIIELFGLNDDFFAEEGENKAVRSENTMKSTLYRTTLLALRHLVVNPDPNTDEDGVRTVRTPCLAQNRIGDLSDTVGGDDVEITLSRRELMDLLFVANKFGRLRSPK